MPSRPRRDLGVKPDRRPDAKRDEDQENDPLGHGERGLSPRGNQ